MILHGQVLERDRDGALAFRRYPRLRRGVASGRQQRHERGGRHDGCALTSHHQLLTRFARPFMTFSTSSRKRTDRSDTFSLHMNCFCSAGDADGDATYNASGLLGEPAMTPCSFSASSTSTSTTSTGTLLSACSSSDHSSITETEWPACRSALCSCGSRIAAFPSV